MPREINTCGDWNRRDAARADGIRRSREPPRGWVHQDWPDEILTPRQRAFRERKLRMESEREV
jgi:hypothetical protein